MVDAALSLSPSLASLLLSTMAAPDPAAASATTAQPAEPFAALFAAVAVGKAATPTLAAPATVMVTAAAPVAPPVVPTADAPAASSEAMLPVAPDEVAAEDDPDAKNASEDPLGDAIAAGATAVLAIAPVMASSATMILALPPAIAPIIPIAPTATLIPIAIDGPMTSKFPAIGGSLPRAPAFKPVRGPKIDLSAVAEDAPDATAATSPGQNATLPPHVRIPAEIAATSEQPTPTPPPPPGAMPTAAALSTATMQGPVASLEQAAAAIGTPDPVVVAAIVGAADPTASTDPAPAIVADAKADQQPPTTQIAKQQAAPVPVPVVRHDDNEPPAPRRIGSDTRKRAPSFDVAPPGIAQRAADTTRVTFGDGSTALHGKSDAVVQQTLSVARDGVWLDSLTRDIVNSAGSGNDLRFKLEPQNLGALTVAISQGANGASIRMTADTDVTRNILLDAQPKLIAEARAQGLKVSDTQVDLSNQHQSSGQDASRWAQSNAGQNWAGQNGAAQNGQNRQSSPAHQPFVSNLGRKADTDAESPPSDSAALYA